MTLMDPVPGESSNTSQKALLKEGDEDRLTEKRDAEELETATANLVDVNMAQLNPAGEESVIRSSRRLHR